MTRKLNLLHLALVTIGSVVVGLLLKHQFKGDWFEFAGLVTGVVAVYLVAVEHIFNWPIGLVNVSIFAYVFYKSGLYADMSLQVFFFSLGIHGWYQWARGGVDRSPLTISRVAKTDWILIVAGWIAGTAIYYPIIKYFNGAAPFADSALTVGSIIAQLLLNRKKLENWIIWILVDIAFIPLFLSRGLVSTALLYSILLGIAISGLLSWRRTAFVVGVQ